MSPSSLSWLARWYRMQCNGDWEHCFGVRITTLDNPGWNVQIDITETELDGLTIDYLLEERSETDWFGIAVQKQQFNAGGDPSKLNFLLQRFQELVEHRHQGTLPEYLGTTYPNRWRIAKD